MSTATTLPSTAGQLTSQGLTWETALGEIAARLRAIRDEHDRVTLAIASIEGALILARATGSDEPLVRVGRSCSRFDNDSQPD